MKAIHSAVEATSTNLSETPILNYLHPIVQAVISQLQSTKLTDEVFIQSAYHYVKQDVRPVYTVDEFQPVSETLRKQMGSCSQRMACLEAISRANSIATRVRGLWIDGRFWYPRFRLSRPFIPRTILLALPQFHIRETWVDFDELFGDTAELVQRADAGFSNSGETLFEAVEHTAVDLLGKTRDCGAFCTVANFDLSRFLVRDEGFFDTRDELFHKFGAFQHSFRGRGFELIFGGRKSV